MGLRVKEPFKGVKELINQDKIAEPLEKGLVRQNFGLTPSKMELLDLMQQILP